MLIDQMHHEVDLRIDKIASQDRPDLYPNEKDDYLNRSINEFVSERYIVNSKSGSGFETNQKMIDSLRNLHIKSPVPQAVLTPTDLGNGMYELQLSNLTYRYLFLTSAEITITNSSNCTKVIDHKNWQIDDTKTLFTEPSYDWGRVLVNFGKANNTSTTNSEIGSIYFDTTNKNRVSQFAITGVYVSYIKYPNRVCLGTYKHIDDTSAPALTATQSCDIDSFFHDEIINIAERLIKADLGIK